MTFDFSETIFFEPGKTRELTAAIDAQREELLTLRDRFDARGRELSAIIADLKLMEEKTRFFAEMVEKTTGVFAPPLPGDGEKALATINRYVLGPADQMGMLLGLMGMPFVLDLTFAGGRYLNIAKEGGKVARMMKSTKYLKVMKVAKASLYLAAAVELTGYIIKLASAREINDQLRPELDKLRDTVAKARRDYAMLVAATQEAGAQRDAMLAEAGVATPEAYVGAINQGLADLGRRKAQFDTARRMLRHDMPPELILTMIEGLTAEALEQIRLRLAAEVRLAAGAGTGDVAAKLGLAPEQAEMIARTVDARDALIRGGSEEDIIGATGLGPGALDDLDDALDEALPALWAQIEGAGPLEPIAEMLILRVTALEDLRRELTAKSMIARGSGTGEIGETLGLPREVVVGWASALPLAREEAHQSRAEGLSDAATLAAATRLPLALVAA
ncbi:hypothetical protein [Poseidonocella sedimentorum]|uniref:Uncharacterized protein n=1 Tax=Poseidonocella sedimentorum TaxID=871652 RepID=A0A1I6EDU9_9RHOB|nr:hypothetical protein [Poseidonocella sedimentorum]SFR15701.1 hypothetical protein SAMN04515673_11035 [Poseidonocella sedimentorum]